MLPITNLEKCLILSYFPQINMPLFDYLNIRYLAKIRTLCKFLYKDESLNAYINTKINQSLELTGDNLTNIIKWLKEDNYVVVHNDNGRFFHNNCPKKTQDSNQFDAFIKNHRIIYVNVSHCPGLLDDGEWNYEINRAGIPECKCGLEFQTGNPNKIPNKEYVEI